MSTTPKVLNDAFIAYVQTFPSFDRLTEHLVAKGQVDQGNEIKEVLDALILTADEYLWSYPGGVSWTPSFERSFQDMLRLRHAWIDDATVARVLAYSRWLCWHEGLSSPDCQ